MSIFFKLNNPPRKLYGKIANETGLSLSTVRNVIKGRSAAFSTKLLVIRKTVELLNDPLKD